MSGRLWGDHVAVEETALEGHFLQQSEE